MERIYTQPPLPAVEPIHLEESVLCCQCGMPIAGLCGCCLFGHDPEDFLLDSIVEDDDGVPD